jgi:hypothetical protein
MTHRKPQPLPPRQPKPVRLAGFLECTACQRTIPYAGYEDPDMDTWPEHRCAAARLEVRPFTRWALKPPVQPVPLPPPPPSAPRRRSPVEMIG